MPNACQMKCTRDRSFYVGLRGVYTQLGSVFLRKVSYGLHVWGTLIGDLASME